MAFRFRKKDKSVGHGLRRIAREQVDKAVAAIEDEKDNDRAIHEVRRRCKNLRGLLRLVRPSFDPFDEEDASFAETAHILSGARDAVVLLATFERLARDFGKSDNAAARDLRRALKKRLADFEAAHDPTIRLGEARVLLGEAKRRAKEWTLGAEGWDAIGPGLRHTCERAAEHFAATGEAPDDDLYHSLRRQVRYHWCHLKLLRRVDHRFVAPRLELAAGLVEGLGWHHDLVVFERVLRGDPAAFGSERDIEAPLLLARRHRTLIEQQCRRDGRKLLSLPAADLEAMFSDAAKIWWGRED